MKPATLLLAAALLLALGATWPLPARLATGLAAGGDAFVHVWDFWWVARAAPPGGPGLFFTRHQFHPGGASLLLHTLAPALSLPGAALSLLAGAAAAFNLLLLLSAPLAALAAFLFARAAGAAPLPAASASLLFAFAPFHQAHARAGHLGLASSWALALLPAAVVLALRRRRPRWALAAGAAWSLAGLTHPYFAVYGALLAAAVLGLHRLRPGWPAGAPPDGAGPRRTAAPLAKIAAAAALGSAPILLLAGATLLEASRAPFVGAHDPTEYSADLLAAFVPTQVLRIGEPAALTALTERWSGNLAERTGYLGWVLLALSLLGARRDPLARPWLALAGAFWVLSLGNRLHVAGEVVRPAVLPYAALSRLVPPLAWGGVPGRFQVLTLLCLLPCAAAGLQALRRWCVPAAALGLLELLPAPFPVLPLPRFPALRALAALPPGSAVLDAGGDPHRVLHRQTLHERPILGGHLSRVPEPAARFLEEEPWPSFFLKGREPPRGDPTPELRRLGVGAVLLEEREAVDEEAVRATWRRRGFAAGDAAVALRILAGGERLDAGTVRERFRAARPARDVPGDLAAWTAAQGNRRLLKGFVEGTLGWRPVAGDGEIRVYLVP